MPFTAQMIATLRAHAEGFMTSSASILESTGSLNGAGGISQSWGNTPESPVRCRIKRRPRVPIETPQSGVMESVAEYIVFLPIGTPISTVNRIVIAGITYEVIGHDSGRTDASQIAVDVKKIA